jgi:hypothetical protein
LYFSVSDMVMPWPKLLEKRAWREEPKVEGRIQAGDGEESAEPRGGHERRPAISRRKLCESTRWKA